MIDRDFYIKNALIYAVVNIVYLMITYMIGVSFMTGFVNMGLSLVVGFGLLIYFGIQARSANGGFILFGEVFKSTMVIYALGAFLFLLFNFVLNTLIDPALPLKMVDAAKDMAIGMAESMGADDAVLEGMYQQFEMEREKALENYTVFGFIKMYLATLVFGAIGSAISGAIVQKKNPNPFADLNA